MKKLKLKAFQVGATELLSRDQMKNVLGGDGGSGVPHECDEDSDCPKRVYSCETGDIEAPVRCYMHAGATTRTCHYSHPCPDV